MPETPPLPPYYRRRSLAIEPKDVLWLIELRNYFNNVFPSLGGGLVVSELVSGTSGPGPGPGPDIGAVLCSWAKQPLSTQVYNVPVKSKL